MVNCCDPMKVQKFTPTLDPFSFGPPPTTNYRDPPATETKFNTIKFRSWPEILYYWPAHDYTRQHSTAFHRTLLKCTSGTFLVHVKAEWQCSGWTDDDSTITGTIILFYYCSTSSSSSHSPLGSALIPVMWAMMATLSTIAATRHLELAIVVVHPFYHCNFLSERRKDNGRLKFTGDSDVTPVTAHFLVGLSALCEKFYRPH